MGQRYRVESEVLNEFFIKATLSRDKCKQKSNRANKDHLFVITSHLQENKNILINLGLTGLASLRRT